jgi:hypothetical protein
MSWSKSVYSTMATEIAYDDSSQSMIVTWRNGRRTAYTGVPEDVALAVSNAPSVGSMINEEIKPNYDYRNL